MWVPMCFFRWLFCEKVLSQVSHLKRFSPVCILVWLSKLPLVINFFSHIWHLKGFSPVCILVCLNNALLQANLFPHIWHENGFSPVGVRMCMVRPRLVVVVMLQILHWFSEFSDAFVGFRELPANSLSSEIMRIWFYSYLFILYPK